MFSHSLSPREAAPASLHLVLCGIDGSRDAIVAAEQALALAPEARLTLLAVTDERGVGANAQASLGAARAQRALDTTRIALRAAGADVTTSLVHANEPSGVLASRARGQDLLAIGAPIGSRAAGIFLGSTAARLLHCSPVPVLVARRPPTESMPFPGRVLLATDGSEGSEHAAALAARIAGERHSDAFVMTVGEAADDVAGRRVAEQVVRLQEATGTEPARLSRPGDPADAIVASAGAVAADLVVLGSRGLTGARALGSVGERVAHRAPCSVLVARG